MEVKEGNGKFSRWLTATLESAPEEMIVTLDSAGDIMNQREWGEHDKVD